MIARSAFIAVLLALFGAATALVAPPEVDTSEGRPLDDLLPEKIEGWREIRLTNAVLPADWTPAPGDDVEFRAYSDAYGRTVTVVFALGASNADSVRLHRPETCYTAHGFSIADKREIASDDARPPLIFLSAENPNRREAISYWIREGNDYNLALTAPERVFDFNAPSETAALVRISSTSLGEQDVEIHTAFIDAFLAAADDDLRRLLLAAPA